MNQRKLRNLHTEIKLRRSNAEIALASFEGRIKEFPSLTLTDKFIEGIQRTALTAEIVTYTALEKQVKDKREEAKEWIEPKESDKS